MSFWHEYYSSRGRSNTVSYFSIIRIYSKVRWVHMTRTTQMCLNVILFFRLGVLCGLLPRVTRSASTLYWNVFPPAETVFLWSFRQTSDLGCGETSSLNSRCISLPKAVDISSSPFALATLPLSACQVRHIFLFACSSLSTSAFRPCSKKILIVRRAKARALVEL